MVGAGDEDAGCCEEWYVLFPPFTFVEIEMVGDVEEGLGLAN